MNKLGLRVQLLFNRWYMNQLRTNGMRSHNLGMPSVSKAINEQALVIKKLEDKLNESTNAG